MDGQMEESADGVRSTSEGDSQFYGLIFKIDY